MLEKICFSFAFPYFSPRSPKCPAFPSPLPILHRVANQVTNFPNATVAEYGTYSYDTHAIMAEVYARGPVKAAVNGTAIKYYKGGILTDSSYENMGHSHGVSIIGWGYDKVSKKQHWIVRNSWGQYWGEMSTFRVEMGRNLLGIESNVAWATPGRFSVHSYPCGVDNGDNSGLNCSDKYGRRDVWYVDPSKNVEAISRRLNEGR